MEQSVAERARGVEALAGQKEPHVVVHAELGQDDDRDHRRDDADAHLAEAELGAVGRDGDVAAATRPTPPPKACPLTAR